MNVVNVVIMHVLIMLLSSCLSRYVQVNKYGDCYDICYIGSVGIYVYSPIFQGKLIKNAREG